MVYDGHADFVYLSDRITKMGFCTQMVYYIMSDGSPEEVLAKIFRVFDVNRWQKHFDTDACSSIDARFWYCILMGTKHMQISIQVFCDASEKEKVQWHKKTP